MHFAYSVDDNTIVEGSPIRNEARLIVQAVPVRVMDGVLAACILLVSYISFRLRKSTALPCDPHRLGGLLLVLRQQPQARRMFLRTGYFGIKEHSQDKTQLTALNKAEGIDIGSTLIDGQAKRLVKNRLQALSVAGDESDLSWLAEDMLQQGNFEALKYGFDGAYAGVNT